MESKKIEVQVILHQKDFERQLKRSTKLAERLAKALLKLQDIKIGVEITPYKKKTFRDYLNIFLKAIKRIITKAKLKKPHIKKR